MKIFIMNNKCWCGRKHHTNHLGWIIHTPLKIYCNKCQGWARHIFSINEEYDEFKNPMVPCMKCLKIGIKPIPLSEFYNERN